MLQTSQLAPFSHIIQEMKNPEKVKAMMLDPANRNPDPISPYFPDWSDLSLASGYPSLLLLFTSLKNEDQNSEAISHQYILKIKEALEKNGCDDFSLFSGISGICFALEQASCSGTRYQPMIKKLDTYLLENIKRVYLEPINYNISQNQPTFVNSYDSIQGVCGIGRYALEVVHKPHFSELTQAILKALVSLSRPLKFESKIIPGWYVLPSDPMNRDEDSLKGNFNLGLAHGVTGILAFLSIAMIRGFEVEGQREAINQIAAWICQHSIQGNENVQWPYQVTWEEEVEKIKRIKEPSRDAWCYGVPGIARTLFLAGKALGNQELKNYAIKALKGVFSRKPEEWGLPGPNLCHGIAGLLLITHFMAKEEGGTELTANVEELEKILLSFYEHDSLFGFKDIEPCKSGGIAPINKVGFLEGSVGVLLTLKALYNPESQFHLPLMIHE